MPSRPPAGPGTAPPRPASPRDFVRLARPTQWAKGIFVLIGPIYALGEGKEIGWAGAVAAVLVFGLASSSGYVVNDIRDREADLAHPRKRRRPIAAGVIGLPAARVYAAALFVAAVGALGIIPLAGGTWGQTGWLALAAALYLANTTAYSLSLKQAAVLDVMSLSFGFVLRVVAGCAAAGVQPSTWLINCTFFVSMFLSFGKRLGERRTMGEDAVALARGVQGVYTEAMLRMMVVVTAVACLVTYSGYVQQKASLSAAGLDILWLTMLPATYGLLRCIVLLESGRYDDPTELAAGDRPFQLAAAAFAFLTVVALLGFRAAETGARPGSGIAPARVGATMGPGGRVECLYPQGFMAALATGAGLTATVCAGGCELVQGDP